MHHKQSFLRQPEWPSAFCQSVKPYRIHKGDVWEQATSLDVIKVISSVDRHIALAITMPWRLPWVSTINNNCDSYICLSVIMYNWKTPLVKMTLMSLSAFTIHLDNHSSYLAVSSEILCNVWFWLKVRLGYGWYHFFFFFAPESTILKHYTVEKLKTKDFLITCWKCRNTTVLSSNRFSIL